MTSLPAADLLTWPARTTREPRVTSVVLAAMVTCQGGRCAAWAGPGTAATAPATTVAVATAPINVRMRWSPRRSLGAVRLGQAERAQAPHAVVGAQVGRQELDLERGVQRDRLVLRLAHV